MINKKKLNYASQWRTKTLRGPDEKVVFGAPKKNKKVISTYERSEEQKKKKKLSCFALWGPLEARGPDVSHPLHPHLVRHCLRHM